MRARRVVRKLPVLAAVSVAVVSVVVAPAGASAAVPGGKPWIVSVGDSAISGEAGRWAGNTEGSPSAVDALGAGAYFDNTSRTAEQIPGCHRSESAEVHVGSGTGSLNLACSGAQTSTLHTPGQDFKPGLDFYSDSTGHKSQSTMLKEFAATHRVTAVTVLIGANNYHFSDIVQTCVLDWYFSPSWAQRHCQDEPAMVADFSTANIAAQTAVVTDALRNVRRAMDEAGYGPESYTIIAQTYSSPIPAGGGFRYPESGYARAVAGCAVWDTDANWVQSTVVPAMNKTIKKAVADSGIGNITVMDAQNLLVGHRLCEKGVGELEDGGVPSWTAPQAPDRTEWVEQVRTASTLFGPYQLQEDGHPNYWGQLALRNCLRQAYNGAPRSGSCTSAPGKNANGEPNTRFH